MKEYDVIVIGAGDVGLGIVFKAASAGLKVALVEKGNAGGTCVNVGCVPSKTLLSSADRIVEIRESGKLGVRAEITNIDFPFIMRRMRDTVKSGRKGITEALADSKDLDWYHEEGRFAGEYVLELKQKKKKIKGKKIFIASGARPFIPPLKGLDSIRYLTNETVVELKERPASIVIIGGGYIAVEYAHFFSAVGTRVTILERGERLVAGEEPEISDLLKKKMSERMDILTGAEVKEVAPRNSGFAVLAKGRAGGDEKEIISERVMVAAGRTSNADLLKPANAGIETDERNFIKVNDHLETSVKNIWALGDAIGKQMFTHAGDREAEIAWHNATHRTRMRMDFGIVPHAIFTYPQIASIGLTEEQAKKNHRVLVGRAKYSDTVKGSAIGEEEGFAKAIVDKRTKRILGFHIIGPEASILIQEVANAAAAKGDVASLAERMHIFPSLSDLVTETLNNLE